MGREISETPMLDKVLQYFRQGRAEPRPASRSEPRIPDSRAAASNTPDEMSVKLSDTESEHRVSETLQPTRAPSRRATAAGIPAGTLLYLVFAAFVACATIGVFFGIGFFLLGQPTGAIIAAAVTHDRATQADPPPSGVLPRLSSDVPAADREARPVSGERETPRSAAAATLAVFPLAQRPAMDEAAPLQESSTARGSISPSLDNEASAGTVTGAIPSKEPTVAAPTVASPLAHPRPDARPGAARAAPGYARSAHHNRKLDAEERAALRQNQRILSAAMDRARREHFYDSPQSLTPPQPGQMNPFDQPLRNK